MLSDDVDHKAVATALIRGQGCVNDIKKIINNGSVPPEALVNNVLDSISLALSLITAPPSPDHASSSPNIAKKTPHLRRRSLQKYAESNICGRERCIDHSTPLIDDGYTWKIYGVKNIKNTPHKRSYSRCSFAKTRNCQAKRRVQKIQEDPLRYRTIYEGQHTCKTPVFSHLMYADTTDHSKMMCFGKLDQSVSDLVPSQPVSNDQQKTKGDKATDRIMTPLYDISELLMDDDQSADGISDFDLDRFLKDLLQD